MAEKKNAVTTKKKCLVMVAREGEFKGVWALGSAKPVLDPSSGMNKMESRPGRFFPVGRTEVELTDEEIASIEADTAAGLRISVAVVGEGKEVADDDAPPPPPGPTKPSGAKQLT